MTSSHQLCMPEDVLEMLHIVRCTLLEDLAFPLSLAHPPERAQMRFQTCLISLRHQRRKELVHLVRGLKALPVISSHLDLVPHLFPGLMAIELVELRLGGHVAGVQLVASNLIQHLIVFRFIVVRMLVPVAGACPGDFRASFQLFLSHGSGSL